jgi:hypothetical protein
MAAGRSLKIGNGHAHTPDHFVATGHVPGDVMPTCYYHVFSTVEEKWITQTKRL